MPQEWQATFCTVVEQLFDDYQHLDWPRYHVRALVREPELIEVYPACDRCEGTGAITDEVETGEMDCPDCDGSGESSDVPEEHRYETPEEVGYRHDPIPYYDRGRTRVEPHRPVER
jgi:hypothetical protein